MINSPPPAVHPYRSEDEAVEAIAAAGPGGAILLASLSTAVVVATWLLFYLLVFLPRGALQ